jgi:hypothetical protein
MTSGSDGGRSRHLPPDDDIDVWQTPPEFPARSRLRSWSAASAVVAPMIRPCTPRTSSSVSEVDRLGIAGLILDYALPLRGVGVVIGEDLKRLAVLRHDTLPDVVYALANLLCGHDP